MKNKYEYKVLQLEEGTASKQTVLNKLGKDGWELVGVEPENRDGWSHDVILYFKRLL